MNLIKLSVYAIGGAVGLSAAAGFAGIGVVASGVGIGLSALEVATIGGAAGASIYKIKDDQAKAKRATQAAANAQRIADAKQVAYDIKVAKARKALKELAV